MTGSAASRPQSGVSDGADTARGGPVGDASNMDGMDRLVERALDGMTATANLVRTTLVTHPRLRAFLGSGRGLFLVALVAWTLTGTLTLAAGQHLLTAVVYAAVAALCTTMTVLLVLVRVALGSGGEDTAP